MDDHDDVFHDITLVQPRPFRQPDPWKAFVCMLLNARVYCKGVMQSISKAMDSR
jgi:hypothetical protein